MCLMTMHPEFDCKYADFVGYETEPGWYGYCFSTGLADCRADSRENFTFEFPAKTGSNAETEKLLKGGRESFK